VAMLVVIAAVLVFLGYTALRGEALANKARRLRYLDNNS